MTVLLRERGVRTALLAGSLALALVAPGMIYNAVTFAPTTAEQFAEAQRILSQFRIPHHTLIERWLDGIACAQIAWIALAIILACSFRLRTVLAVSTALAVLLSIMQVVTGSDSLALLFPWRISAVLAPVATTIILARAIAAASRWANVFPDSARFLWRAGCWV